MTQNWTEMMDKHFGSEETNLSVQKLEVEEFIF